MSKDWGRASRRRPDRYDNQTLVAKKAAQRYCKTVRAAGRDGRSRECYNCVTPPTLIGIRTAVMKTLAMALTASLLSTTAMSATFTKMPWDGKL
jgi:hypothetical protein